KLAEKRHKKEEVEEEIREEVYVEVQDVRENSELNREEEDKKAVNYKNKRIFEHNLIAPLMDDVSSVIIFEEIVPSVNEVLSVTKGNRRSIIVNEFLLEKCNQLKLNEEEIRIYLNISTETKFLNIIAIFAFDNSTNHKAYAEDALNTTTMNLKPNRNQLIMRSTTFVKADE
ncbi:2083_t:CDS:2, partial [Scutellospora calospora]